MAQLVASMSGVVLGGVVEVVGLNLNGGKIFTASIGSVESLRIYLLCESASVSDLVYLESNDVCEIIFPYF